MTIFRLWSGVSGQTPRQRDAPSPSLSIFPRRRSKSCILFSPELFSLAGDYRGGHSTKHSSKICLSSISVFHLSNYCLAIAIPFPPWSPRTGYALLPKYSAPKRRRATNSRLKFTSRKTSPTSLSLSRLFHFKVMCGFSINWQPVGGAGWAQAAEAGEMFCRISARGAIPGK